MSTNSFSITNYLWNAMVSLVTKVHRAINYLLGRRPHEITEENKNTAISKQEDNDVQVSSQPGSSSRFVLAVYLSVPRSSKQSTQPKTQKINDRTDYSTYDLIYTPRPPASICSDPTWPVLRRR